MVRAAYEAYKLFQDGAIALAQVEANGIRVDMERLERTMRKVRKRIAKQEDALKHHSVYRKWVRRFGSKASLGSPKQLATIVFDELGYKRTTKEGEKDKADEATFVDVIPKEDFVRDYFQLKKLQKVESTYLKGIHREVVFDEELGIYLLHAFYNLHTVRTFRGSSDRPNFQNIPVRNPEMGKLIRSAFIPRDGHCLLELDFAGIEVRIAACYTHDPVLMRYVSDPTTDMHRDMAAQLYKCKPELVSKGMRYCAKNMFVFPQFYGDYYINCTNALWEAVERMDLKLADDTPLREHLERKGILKKGACNPDKEPKKGTFEHHVREVEREYWNVKYKVYTKWKNDLWSLYRKQGYIKTISQFLLQGVYKRNEILNAPIQGFAFHCLLWCLVEMNKWLRKHKMRSLVVGQIHDSIILDVHEDEVEDVLAYAKKLMTQKLRKRWPEIVVPIDIEAELAPVGASWFEKKPVEL